jgi:L-alanine-DL-glutamate epimerase-like enolase superfamily enzyme
MADNFLSYTYDEAVQVGQVLDDLAYTWYESPMPETDDWMDRYVRLREQVRLPVVAPETNPAAHDARIRWIEAGATDMGRLDVFFGGLTSCWKVVQACERAGIPMDLHCSLYPHLQIMAATSEARLPYLEDYGEPLPWEMDAEGYLPLPQGVGVGFDLDWDFIEANRLDWSALAPD